MTNKDIFSTEDLEKEIKKRKKKVRDRGITQEDMDKEENDGYSKESYWDGDIMVLEKLKLERQRLRIEVEKVIEPVDYRIREIIENYKYFNNVPSHITFLVKEWGKLKSKLGLAK